MKLYTDSGNFQALKVLTAANLSNSKLEREHVKFAEHVVPYITNSKLPVLEIKDGQFLFSTNAAAKYLCQQASLILDEDAENEVADWENESLLPKIAAYLVSAVGQGKKDKTLEDEVSKILKQLESKLGKSKTKFFTGDALGLGDICVFATIYPLLCVKNSNFFDALPKTNEWVAEVQNVAAVQAAISEVTGGKVSTDVFKASLVSQSFPPHGSPSSSASKPPKAAPSEEEVSVEVVGPEEVAAALEAWNLDPSKRPQPEARVHPVLPKEEGRNILITSALPYVNNVPHLGNIIGCVLSADIYSRFARLRNYNVLYICGTDEYGTTTESKALEEGVTPQQICDKYNKLHSEIYQWFNIDFDYFGRTTTKQQTEIVQDLFWKLYNGGYILKESVDQLYCEKCKKFLADRFVEGTCPFCKFEDARGDQCDACGKLINAVELKNPLCKTCSTSPVVKTSNHLFLDLPKIEPKLHKHLDEVFATGTWTHNAQVITQSWIRDGLKPRCISRDLKWGVQVPLEGYKDKVFYVWFDAPVGYISITANYTDQWKKWWKNHDKVEMYNFLGKDNVPFHSVIFPASLLGANDGYSVVKHMVATEYLNYEDKKFSKSRGTGVFGHDAKDTGIPADVYRFYLLYVRPESQDSAFSWDDFQMKNNSELLNNLGNFINRSLTFVSNTFNGEIQPMQITEEDTQLMALVTRELCSYITNLEACKLRDGIRNILAISRLGNQYMQNNKPWVLCKGNAEEKKRAGAVVSLCANVVCQLSVLLKPYMPRTSAIIQEQLQAPPSVNIITDKLVAFLKPGHKIGKPSPLFQKLETDLISNLKAKFAGQAEEKTPSKKPGKANAKAAADASKPAASPEEIERLTKAVADQGIKVRELKAAKAEKPAIDAEVAVLLQLKKDLALAEGKSPDAKPAKGKKGNKQETEGNKKSKQAEAKKAENGSGAAGDSAAVDRLTQAVADQGNKVRDLKAKKADKPAIDKEVQQLLQLKRDLATAQGLDPDAQTGSGKSKGKKK